MIQSNKSPERLKLESIMNNCYGTSHYYSNKFLKFNYTDGIKCFCENAGGGAYWLLDLVNSLFFNKKTVQRMDCSFVSIRLLVNKDTTASITFVDGDGAFYDQLIPFTDCPEGEWMFFFDNGVLLWSGEY